MHRNSQKRIYVEEGIYFVTFNTKDRYPYFVEEIFCEVFMENLRICIELKHFKLYAHCLLYDHAHLLLKPGRGYDMSKIVKSLKENTSRDINCVISNHRNESDTSTCRFRLRQKMHVYRREFIHKYSKSQSEMPIFRWQKSFHDHVIRDERDFANHLSYTAYNHLKHGLNEDWRYTSANNPGFANLA
jgi:putative transposase